MQTSGKALDELFYRVLGASDDLTLNKADALNLVVFMSQVDLAMLRTVRAMTVPSRGGDVEGVLAELQEAVDQLSVRQAQFMEGLANRNPKHA